MPKLTDLRLDAGLNVSQLAQRASVSRPTVEKAERGEPIRPELARKIVNVLSQELGRKVTEVEAEIQTL